MRIDYLNKLADCSNKEFHDESDKVEEWKPHTAKALYKAMYVQWNHVMSVLRASLDGLKEPGEKNFYSKGHIENMKASLLAGGYEIASKIRSSETSLYIIRMQNAAIIRKNAQFIKISTNGFVLDDLMDEQHRLFIREEIDRFRDLFKQWVASFEKDDCADEWGLFI